MTDFANITFAVERDHLVMHAAPRGASRGYRHACPLASYEVVARELAGSGPHGVTRGDLRERTGLAWTRINVAALFLYERSIIERAGPRHGRYVPASRTVLEDAMVEYHALAEGEGAESAPEHRDP